MEKTWISPGKIHVLGLWATQAKIHVTISKIHVNMGKTWILPGKMHVLGLLAAQAKTHVKSMSKFEKSM